MIRSSIVGLGTDEESLTRAEVDMKKVKEYKVRYRKQWRRTQCGKIWRPPYLDIFESSTQVFESAVRQLPSGL